MLKGVSALLCFQFLLGLDQYVVNPFHRGGIDSSPPSDQPLISPNGTLIRRPFGDAGSWLAQGWGVYKKMQLDQINQLAAALIVLMRSISNTKKVVRVGQRSESNSSKQIIPFWSKR